MNFRINSLNPWLLPLLLGMATLSPTDRLQAHETEVEGKMAATWHIEPNDAPEAGKPSQVWIALTRAGGEVIPLSDCDCRLKIWSVPKGPQPILEPDLTSISADHYQGIPAADVIFPDRGQYELELIGTPKAGAVFEAFTFTNEILVATGEAIETSTPPGTTAPYSLPPASPAISGSEPSEDLTDRKPPVVGSFLPVAGVGLGILILGGGWILRIFQNQDSS